jgi:hypothetical protein
LTGSRSIAASAAGKGPKRGPPVGYSLPVLTLLPLLWGPEGA